MPPLTDIRGRLHEKQTAALLKHRFDPTGLTWTQSRPKGPWVTRETLEKAIHGSFGVVTRIAKKLDVTPHTVYQHLKKKGNEDLLELFKHEAEGFVDRAEQTVMDSMENGLDTRTAFNAARFVLDRKGKERGWTKPDPAAKQPINVTANFVDLSKVALPLDMRMSLLAKIEAEGKEQITIDAPAGTVSLLPAPASEEECVRIVRRDPTEVPVLIRKRAM